jgi:hypothetical protein
LTGLFITLEGGEGGEGSGKSTTPAASTGRTATYAFSPAHQNNRPPTTPLPNSNRVVVPGECRGGGALFCRGSGGVPQISFSPVWGGEGWGGDRTLHRARGRRRRRRQRQVHNPRNLYGPNCYVRISPAQQNNRPPTTPLPNSDRVAAPGECRGGEARRCRGPGGVPQISLPILGRDVVKEWQSRGSAAGSEPSSAGGLGVSPNLSFSPLGSGGVRR